MKKFIAPIVACLFALFFFVGCTPTIQVQYKFPDNVSQLELTPFAVMPLYVAGSDPAFEHACGTLEENCVSFEEEFEATSKSKLTASQKRNIANKLMPKILYLCRAAWLESKDPDKALDITVRYTVRHVKAVLAELNS